MLHHFAHDVRYGLRTLARQPLFTFVVILTLALGIGANTAIFSVVNAVLLRPLPYPDPDRLVTVSGWDLRRPETRTDSQGAVSFPDFADWRAWNTTLAHVAAYTPDDFTLTDGGGRGEAAAHVAGAYVTADLFPLLGVAPALGRTFLPAEDVAGSRVAILSHGLWQRRFGGDPRVLGRAMTVDGNRFEIVGVMPSGFGFPVQNNPVEFWLTVARLGETTDDDPQTAQRGNHFLLSVARLRPGVSLAQAQANLDALTATLRQQYPDSDNHLGVHLVPLRRSLAGEVRPALLVLLGAAGCVLLIACVNVANLLLARATARGREIAIRAALGAGRARIVRQLLTESLLLALLGGAGGVLLALWGTDGLVALLPDNFPRLREIGVDLRVLLFTGVVSVLTGVLFGLAPAWRISRPDGADAALRADGAAGARGTTEGGRSRRLREVLVVAEMALALALLTGAGLLVQSFLRLQRVAPGFDPHGVLTAEVSLAQADDKEQTTRNVAFYRDVLDRVSALPGVRAVSAVVPLPMGGRHWATGVIIAGRPRVGLADLPASHFRAVAPGYFAAMRIPLRSGRDFDAHDEASSPGVVIINETFARQYFPGENPLGKHIAPQMSADPGEPRDREIVGVVGNVKFRRLSADDKPECYVPHTQFPAGALTLVVRGGAAAGTTATTEGDDGDPLALAGAVRGAVEQINRDVPLYRVRRLDQYLADSLAQPRLNTLLLSLFAGAAALLTAVGLYGVMAYAVAQRTREIGIRLALGAGRNDVRRLVAGYGLRLTLVGLVTGVVTTLGLTRLLASLLYGISPGDPTTLAGISALLAATAALACWLPARRATRVDPVVALRQE